MSSLPISMLVWAVLAQPATEEYPKTLLRNEQCTLTVYLPDAKKGFYRGTRFDWAGVVGHVEVNGRKIFGPWKDGHNPANHDDIVGPCEEFGMHSPLGYDQARVGDTFLKIGVGALIKPKEDKYHFSNNYEIKYPGEWQVTTRHRDVEFRQELLARSGHGYRYTKRVILEDVQPRFVISHELTNSGTETIDTDVYNHNFFNVDQLPVGPEYGLQLTFTPKPVQPRERFNELVTIAGGNLSLKGKLDTGTIFAELDGMKGDVTDHRFTLRHNSGVNVYVEGNTPVYKFNLWGIKGCLCPEPYVRIQLKPGETKKWATTYYFQVNR